MYFPANLCFVPLGLKIEYLTGDNLKIIIKLIVLSEFPPEQVEIYFNTLPRISFNYNNILNTIILFNS